MISCVAGAGVVVAGAALLSATSAATPGRAMVATLRMIADKRYADDVHINREMREVERWNDPASEFLTVSPTLFPFHKSPFMISTQRICPRK